MQPMQDFVHQKKSDKTCYKQMLGALRRYNNNIEAMSANFEKQANTGPDNFKQHGCSSGWYCGNTCSFQCYLQNYSR